MRADRKPPGTPWSASDGTAGGSTPARGLARGAAGAPPSDRNSSRPEAGTGADGRDRAPTWARRPAEAETALARAARALGHRHALAVSGFDGPELDAVVVGEFLAAVDDVLARWPVIAVRRVAVASLGASAVVRVALEQASDSEAPGWYVTLDEDAAADPGLLEEMQRARHRPGAAVAHADERPVYAATVREFGRALDLAGGEQARGRAQRCLIGEYLRGGNRAAGLGAVVAGYKRWRDQLSGASFDRGRFDPGAALADAFTDVMLNGDSASEPAKTLCGLLTDTVAVAAGPGDRL
ncbi:hypothetical protein [Nocardia blacklockiae]|uniref:hypothetical protein n=1 Tax=Nocardia blacklockiae TaxID=480036 RepID=UPI0018952DF3|nr:hypothetical protein [Nocardia blacklockiae]MBF6174891.1 hypothetical protein [Nocardia blacklockiae]